MKAFGSFKSKITKDENDKNVPYLKITEVVLAHINIINNNYQPNSNVLYTFVSNNLFGQLLDTLRKKSYMFKNFWLRIFLY